MSKRNKLIQKICNAGQVSINEIKSLMISLGYEVRQSGSHITFSKKGVLGITIPARSHVLPVYLRQLCELLRENEGSES